MAYHKKASDEAVKESYARTKSVWKTGEELGMCGQAVHERLKKLGVDTTDPDAYTKEQLERVKKEYQIYCDAGKLQELADELGKLKSNLCRKARGMGLTDKCRPKKASAVWKYLPEDVCRPIFEKLKKSRLTVNEFCKKNNYGVSAFTCRMQELFPQEWANYVEAKKSKQPMYKRGRDFEYRTKRLLEKKGYVVVRSYASRTPADLTATKDGKTIFIQCKLRGDFPVKEWNEFMDYCESAGVEPILAQRAADGPEIEFYKLIGRKDGSKRPQPKESYEV
jgi:Holliday junction resolvase